MKPIFLFVFILVGFPGLKAQHTFTWEDTLRGSITPARAWWDLKHYDLRVTAIPETKTISGQVTIRYKVTASYQIMQIDLQAPLVIEKVIQDGVELSFKKQGDDAYMVELKKTQQVKKAESITVFYKGIPKEAKNPPWQGGVQWTTDDDGNPFIATSCQGLGASVWWPCKDHMYDEPDSMTISITVPEKLMDISNGRLRSIVSNNDGTKTFTWAVRNPINNYGVNMNIGNYVHFKDTLHGLKGVLDMDYYVLPYNLDKAKEQFKQAKLMMRAFEHWFGPYPFYTDGYKLVEVPYLGMEHQSSVTYGNGYENGYRGRDLSQTGWGLKWDFIIIHESGHEWFANNITYKDIADMWIHESFTNYSENLYTEYYYGKQAGSEYVIGTRKAIKNDRPIIGKYNVNSGGSGDMYYKGGNMLHTIRQIIDNDKKWRKILKGLNKKFYHQTVETSQIEHYMIKQSRKDLSKIFDQYLRDARVPRFDYSIHSGVMSYRWRNTVAGFNMPVRVRESQQKAYRWLYPTTDWQTAPIKSDSLIVDENFYVEVRKVQGIQ
ncbi:MAG: M1 family metallopeptidase [Saprospiraceae bacterium]|nr:M1 family metallopeptidase [Saprospiraceae bacterium]